MLMRNGERGEIMALIAENMAAVAAFALCLVGFALGYLLRSWADEGRAWADSRTYRRRGDRRANGGR